MTFNAEKKAQAEIAFIRDVLLEAAISNTQRLGKGLELRNRMWQEKRAGKKPEGYRYPWLKNSARKVVDLLDNIAHAFNTSHGDDMASNEDLSDIIKVAAAAIKKRGTP